MGARVVRFIQSNINISWIARCYTQIGAVLQGLQATCIPHERCRKGHNMPILGRTCLDEQNIKREKEYTVNIPYMWL